MWSKEVTSMSQWDQYQIGQEFVENVGSAHQFQKGVKVSPTEVQIEYYNANSGELVDTKTHVFDPNTVFIDAI